MKTGRWGWHYAGWLKQWMNRCPVSIQDFRQHSPCLRSNNGISVDTTLLGYAWAWCENQVLASVKLVPLGHRTGQLMLRSLGERLDSAVTQALACTDDSIGVTAPGFVLASAKHETQHTRLFRS